MGSKEIWVFGDSHWRVFFDETNHAIVETPMSFDVDGFSFVDSTGNCLSGATMRGLRNEGSSTGARMRILETLNSASNDVNVGLVFGEVDCRSHHGKMNTTDHMGWVVDQYVEFIDRLKEITSGTIFVYFGFAYTPEFFEGNGSSDVMDAMLVKLGETMSQKIVGDRIVLIERTAQVRDKNGRLLRRYRLEEVQGLGEVHLNPRNTFRDFILPVVKETLGE